MSRKGKEPPGLRRWRLAHRKKKRKTRSVAKVARRRRYSGRKRRGRKSKSIPVLMSVVAAMPAIKATSTQLGGVGFTAALPDRMVYEYTGYSTNLGTWDSSKATGLGTGLLVAFIGHKIANKVGVNRSIKKLTGGWLVL